MPKRQYKIREVRTRPRDHDGETFDRNLDQIRLNAQLWTVWVLMKDREWRTLYEISDMTGYPEQSISARLRDFRKEKWGSHIVNRRRVSGGTWEYQLIPNRTVVMAR